MLWDIEEEQRKKRKIGQSKEAKAIKFFKHFIIWMFNFSFKFAGVPELEALPTTFPL